MRKSHVPIALVAVFVTFAIFFPGQFLRAQTPAAAPPSSPQLVILDTDIGDDIDDAFALALILRSPEFQLLGIQTAFGDTELRARLVDRYLAAVGRTDIPVLAGVPGKPTHFTQAAYARQAPDREHDPAVPFLLNQIRAHPGQITLIAIGPLFNIQAAIAQDPETFRQLKRVVLMGGSVYRGYDKRIPGSTASGSADVDTHTPPTPEWNILCDPAGAQALFAAGVPVYVMPLDSTQVHLERPALGVVFAHGSPLTDQLTLLYHQWTGASDWRAPTLFDPVAVTYAIRPDLCPAAPLRLEVDDKGFTRPVPGEPNAQVCLQSDEKGFLDLLINRITVDTAQ
jgi:purine nucleosidase